MKLFILSALIFISSFSYGAPSIGHKNIDHLIQSVFFKPHWDQSLQNFYFLNPKTDEFIHVVAKSGQSKVVLTRQQVEEIITITGSNKTAQKLFINAKLEGENLLLNNNQQEFLFSLSPFKYLSSRPNPVTQSRLLFKSEHMSDPSIYERASSDFRKFIGIEDGHLYLRENEEVSRISGVRKVSHKQGFDLRNLTWSPNGDYALINTKDYAKAPEYELNQGVKVTYVTPKDQPVRDRLYLINLKNKTASPLTHLNTGFPFIEMNGWVSNNEFIYSIVSRAYQTRVYFRQHINGSRKKLFTESTSTYLDDYPISARQKSLQFKTNDSTGLLLSERSGKRLVYKVDLRTGKTRQWFKFKYIVEEVMHADLKKDEAIFTAYGADKNPLNIHLFKYSNSRITRLTPLGRTYDLSSFNKIYRSDKSQEGIFLSPDKKIFISFSSNVKKPVSAELRSIEDGKVIKNLAVADISELKKTGWEAPEEFSFMTEDGKEHLHGVIFKPFNFDPSKKYPVINFIYGGPQFSWTPVSFYSDEQTFAYTMARAGFVVIMLDARGTPNRGKAFQDYTYQRFGQVEVFDHVHILKKLIKNNSYLDGARIGVIGSSFGGFQVLNFIGRYPSFFKVAIANAAVENLADIHDTSVHMFMGNYEKNKKHFELSSVRNKLGQHDSNLLIMHGEWDYNAPLFNMKKLFEFMDEEKIEYQLFIDPDSAHSRTQKTWDKIQSFFEENL